jgi:hypothetical protein
MPLEDFNFSFLITDEVIILSSLLTAGNNDRSLRGVNCLRPLECWSRGFESHSRHGCLCAFIHVLSSM